MAQIFPKKANLLPLLTLGASAFGFVIAVFLVWYYFSPEFTDVGYRPEQPVEFSHEFHAGQLDMDCRYCHNWVEEASHSNVPATQTCMNCHNQIKTESPKLAPVRESWADDVPIQWVKVHHLPDYARFSHASHVDAGVGCETCHGRIDQMEVVAQSEPLSMGWCLECHRQPELYLRPTDEVTTMGYVQPADFVDRNLEKVRREGIRPPTNCSACHY
ncbi:cytochrome C [Longimonas halophila]|uniref:Cytochrome C n=1 Tax=Longimonas halophila TaxID=1469170 RepID=A0A2H3NJP8_9BACT|nr:cytochrome c3 family protein [Longimonas halophila]PEN06030.1 cytochrome C [Longimonas halophila]